MKTTIFTFLFLLILANNEIFGQKRVSIDETNEWIYSKLKLYAKEARIDYSTMYVIKGTPYSEKDYNKLWHFEIVGKKHSNDFILKIYPTKILSYKISEDTIIIKGTNIFSLHSDNFIINEGNDDLRFLMNFDSEENLKERIKKALDNLLFYTKKKKKSNEPF